MDTDPAKPAQLQKILVVDNLPTNRKLLRITLEPAGYTVVEAGDGVEALQVLDREPVDAIISGILMPNMDGFRFCHKLRKSEGSQSIQPADVRRDDPATAKPRTRLFKEGKKL